jgi:peptide/nickel transport system permease protein
MRFLKDLFYKKPIGFACLVVLVIILILGAFADFAAPTAFENGSLPKDLMARMQRPFASAEHLLGTDTLGQDLLSYMIYGARTSVILCVCCTVLSALVSIIIGVLSAVLGGTFDLIVQRIVDAFGCIPQMLLLLILMAMLGNGIPQMIFALAIPSGIGGSRMVRSAAMGVKDSGYCENSDLLGGGVLWKSIHHVLPNILPLVIISAAGSLGGVIMMESSLSFLGYGVAPGTPSWGYLITSQGRAHLFDAPWLCIVPGVAITLLTFAASMFGDCVRDLLDPRLKGGVGSYNPKKLKNILAKLNQANGVSALNG